MQSRAWIWLFSSTHITKGLSGGFRYSPTTTEHIRRDVFQSVPDLTAAIGSFIAHRTWHQPSFTCRVKVEDILVRVARAQAVRPDSPIRAPLVPGVCSRGRYSTCER